jgi:hypothetical protein
MGKKISEYPTLVGGLSANSDVLIVQNGINYKAAASAFNYVPNVVLVDYIQTADQSGYVIPENCIGRKGNTPYFGNSPMREYATKHVVDNTFSTTISAEQRTLLASFPINGPSVAPTQLFSLRMNLSFEFSSGSIKPIGSYTGWALQITTSSSTSIHDGNVIFLGADNMQNLSIDGYTNFQGEAINEVSMQCGLVRGVLSTAKGYSYGHEALSGHVIRGVEYISSVHEQRLVDSELRIYISNFSDVPVGDYVLTYGSITFGPI